MAKKSTSTAGVKANEYKLVDSFKLGYRNREDITNTAPGVLIVGSQNVLTNVSERVQIRKGYSLDGATSSVAAPILSSFDWLTRNNGEKHLRAGFLTSLGNDGKLQYRYVDSNGAVSWRDLMTSLTTVSFNFSKYWNTTESLREALFVDGSTNVYRWNGAVTTVASGSVNTITKTGTQTWLDAGFYASGNKKIVINGVEYTYTGGENSTTLTGVTPSAVGVTNGQVAHQQVVTVATSTFTGGVPSTFAPGLIGTLNNQVYLASLNQSVVWISTVNNYTDYTSSTPRQTGEGAVLILDDNIVAFEPQENFMYVSAGKDLWYNVSFEVQTSTVGVTYEQVSALPLKTGRQQGAKSQAFVSHMKNDIIVVTNEPTIDTFGRVESSLATPQQTNISDPIKLDIDRYDFTDGCIFYYKYYIYVALPKENLVLGFSLTNRSWDAPATMPISRFYIVDGELYGHSYATSESYKLFDGYADRVYPGFNGFPIDAKAIFSYQNYGSRSMYKRANGFYIEGYVNENTVINCSITYELDGCATQKLFQVNGDDRQIVCIPFDDGSFGKKSFGKQKFGGQISGNLTGLPPKFRVEKTFNNTDFFEASFGFEILGIDQRFELLAFGLNSFISSQEPVQIRQ